MIRENSLHDELKVRDIASSKRVCTANHLRGLTHASGNLNPIHLPRDDGEHRSAAGAEREIEE